MALGCAQDVQQVRHACDGHRAAEGPDLDHHDAERQGRLVEEVRRGQKSHAAERSGRHVHHHSLVGRCAVLPGRRFAALLVPHAEASGSLERARIVSFIELSFLVISIR